MNTKKYISETDREDITEEYKKKEEKSRKVFYSDDASGLLDILFMLGNDIVLYDTIDRDGSIEELSKKVNNEEIDTFRFLIQELNYYLDKCPELFEEEKFKNKSENSRRPLQI